MPGEAVRTILWFVGFCGLTYLAPLSWGAGAGETGLLPSPMTVLRPLQAAVVSAAALPGADSAKAVADLEARLDRAVLPAARPQTAASSVGAPP